MPGVTKSIYKNKEACNKKYKRWVDIMRES